MNGILSTVPPYYHTTFGKAYLGDSLDIMTQIPESTIDLVLTSPPFALTHKKEYDNVEPEKYIEWFLPFAFEIKRILKDTGSLVLDLGGSWVKRKPIKNLYQYKLLIELCESLGYNLAQDIYWYNPAKLPTPAQWVAVKRIRLKDAVNNIWWLSKTPYPKANNKNVLVEYSASMKNLLENGYKPKARPSGHIISSKFNKNNQGSIQSNLLSIANTSSNDKYLRKCKQEGIKPHPARFPRKIPEFFIDFLTNNSDIVLDPFAGSNMVGKISEERKRNWISIEIEQKYLDGSRLRFDNDQIL